MTADLGATELRAIAERALPHWDLAAADLELVSHSENTVFRVDGADGRAYALRIHRPGYHTIPELESERVWTRALNDAGVQAPVGRPTRDGPGYVAIPTSDGAGSRVVGVVDWTPGVLLEQEIERAADAAAVAGHFERLGRIAAAIHNQSSGWTPPPGFARHRFDAEGFVGERPFWGRFWDLPLLTPAQRALLTRTRDRIAARLLDYGTGSDTFSLIHADLHPHNVVVGSDGRLHVIDFDDAGFGWHQYELAVALFDYDDDPALETVQAALLAGYRSVRPFSDAALALLPLFLLIRRCVLLGWVWDRPELGYRDRLPPMIEAACARADAHPF